MDQTKKMGARRPYEGGDIFWIICESGLLYKELS